MVYPVITQAGAHCDRMVIKNDPSQHGIAGKPDCTAQIPTAGALVTYFGSLAMSSARPVTRSWGGTGPGRAVASIA